MKRLEWQEERFVEKQDDQGRCLTIVPDIDVSEIGLQGVDVVIIPFGAFKDGRGFSMARRLRQQGFRGDIRATGALFLDQIGLAVRSGFTSFALDQVPAAEEATNAVHRYSVYFQAAHLGAHVWELRG